MAEHDTAARPAPKAPGAAPEKLTAASTRVPEKLTRKSPNNSPLSGATRPTKDFTALRAYVQRIPPAVFARTYYHPDDDRQAATPGAMEQHLNAMLDALVALRSPTVRPRSRNTCARRSSSTGTRCSRP
ncbi:MULTISPECIES: hypothetical protein [unclassified Caballeronia]|uniref:hypothetical protein n=1 Tax=unclassified Caballeronia TaxID=2646786 RepID=UPI002027F6EE|nr:MULTISPECIES: hypothetical protein [unclassified Caballeronia]